MNVNRGAGVRIDVPIHQQNILGFVVLAVHVLSLVDTCYYLAGKYNYITGQIWPAGLSLTSIIQSNRLHLVHQLVQVTHQCHVVVSARENVGGRTLKKLTSQVIRIWIICFSFSCTQIQARIHTFFYSHLFYYTGTHSFFQPIYISYRKKTDLQITQIAQIS